MTDAKATIRAEVRRRLAELSEAERARLSGRIADRLLALPAWRSASTVMAFLSLPDEVQTAPIVSAAWADGKRVFVPRVDWERRRMIAVEIRSLAEGLRVGRHGLIEPASGAPIGPAEIDLLLAPGVAFDDAGGRIGRGGGYYDRFCAQVELRAPVCGLAFDCQRVASVPRAGHDRRIDLLVTESAVRAFTPLGRSAAEGADGTRLDRSRPIGR